MVKVRYGGQMSLGEGECPDICRDTLAGMCYMAMGLSSGYML